MSKKHKPEADVECPKCKRSVNVGKLSNSRSYCSECAMEIHREPGSNVTVGYNVSKSGELSEFNPTSDAGSKK